MVTTQIDSIPNRVAVAGKAAASNAQVIALQRQLATSENEARDSSALLDLLTRLQASDNLSHACRLLVNDLRAYLQCGTLIVSTHRGPRGGSTLRAISGMPELKACAVTVSRSDSVEI